MDPPLLVRALGAGLKYFQEFCVKDRFLAATLPVSALELPIPTGAIMQAASANLFDSWP
jgi:hypothetical protein